MGPAGHRKWWAHTLQGDAFVLWDSLRCRKLYPWRLIYCSYSLLYVGVHSMVKKLLYFFPFLLKTLLKSCSRDICWGIYQTSGGNDFWPRVSLQLYTVSLLCSFASFIEQLQVLAYFAINSDSSRMGVYCQWLLLLCLYPFNQLLVISGIVDGYKHSRRAVM